MQLGRTTRFAGRTWVASAGGVDPPTESGDVRFTASPDHAEADSYEVRVRAVGSETVVASENIGKPTPSAQNTITVNMSVLFATLDPGNYTVSVAAIDFEGSYDSEPSDAFSLPLS